MENEIKLGIIHDLLHFDFTKKELGKLLEIVSTMVEDKE